MMHELAVLIEHNIKMYCINLMFNYRESIETNTKCFYLPLNQDLQFRTHIGKNQINQLINYLSEYLEKLND